MATPTDRAATGPGGVAPFFARAGRDLLHALRGLTRRRTLAVIAILSLALGTGSAVVLFSLVRSILLKPLAYPHPERLVVIRETTPSAQQLYPDLPANPQHFRFWQQQSRSFEGMAAFESSQVTLSGAGEPQRLDLIETTANLFSILGIRPRTGRSFLAEEERPGRNRVVVITDNLWHRSFGGAPDLLGRTINLDGIPHTVVGILPPSFRFPRRDDLGVLSRLGERAEVFRPVEQLGEDWMGNFDYNVLGRLKPGVTPEQARAELDPMQIALRQAHSEIDTDLRVSLRPLQEVLTAPIRTGLYALLAAVGLLLLIVCVNLANLLLASFTARARELAVRAAVGASTGMLVQQVVAETLVIALAGGVLGTLVAAVSLRTFLAAVPIDLPRLDEVTLDGAALLFALGLVLTCALLSGLIPALRLARTHARSGLRVSPTFTEGRPTLRLRELLVGSEVSLSVLLLILAGLLTSSLWHLLQVNKGFSVERAVVVDVNLPEVRYPEESRAAFFDRLVASVRELPGVRSAGFVSKLPLSGEAQVNPVFLDGASDLAKDPETGEMLLANVRFVAGDYFATLGLPLLQGRGIQDTDRERPIALMSAHLAAKLWPGRSPLGRSLRTFSGVGTVEIVGVVADVHANGLDKTVTPTIYVPVWGRGPVSGHLVLRTEAAPAAQMQDVRSRIWALDPELSVPPLRTLGDIVADSVAQRRFQMQIAGGFALAALLLACLGIYGVVSYSVSERRAEIGIRIALGAKLEGIIRMVVARGLRSVLLGLLIGTTAALLLGRLIRSLLFGISAQDPLTVAGAVLAILAIAALACLVPALAAARTDPVRALRD